MQSMVRRIERRRTCESAIVRFRLQEVEQSSNILMLILKSRTSAIISCSIGNVNEEQSVVDEGRIVQQERANI
jgi:hypothetical protein